MIIFLSRSTLNTKTYNTFSYCFFVWCNQLYSIWNRSDQPMMNGSLLSYTSTLVTHWQERVVSVSLWIVLWMAWMMSSNTLHFLISIIMIILFAGYIILIHSFTLLLCYGLDSRVSFPGTVNERIFSLRHLFRTSSGSHPASCPVGTGAFYTRSKAAGEWSWPLISI